MLTPLFSSRQERPETKEAARELAGADKRPDIDARATDLLDRIRQHQPGNPGRDEERRRGHEADPRQHEDGGCR